MSHFLNLSTVELLKSRDRSAWELLYDELASDLRGFV
jgi:hypothetical protein